MSSVFLLPLLVGFPPPVSAVIPLQAEQFAWEWRFHLNRQKVDFVLDGLSWVFLLAKCSSLRRKNKPSAAQHPCVLDQYLAKLAALGLFPNEANQGRRGGGGVEISVRDGIE